MAPSTWGSERNALRADSGSLSFRRVFNDSILPLFGSPVLRQPTTLAPARNVRARALMGRSSSLDFRHAGYLPIGTADEVFILREPRDVAQDTQVDPVNDEI